MKAYLVQRGTINDNEYKIGFDSIVSLDYMGVSEYEWGAVPQSLQRIRDKINDYIYCNVLVFDKIITVFCKNDQKLEIQKYLEELATGKMYTKGGSYFNQYVNPSKFEIESQKKHPLLTNFWWDIENDLMFWKKDDEFETKFKAIIVKKPS